jgi:hypothetical protein
MTAIRITADSALENRQPQRADSVEKLVNYPGLASLQKENELVSSLPLWPLTILAMEID